MKIRALRGVCVGVERHLKAGDSADLDTAMVTFLVGIGAVEVVKDEPVKPVESVKQDHAPSPIVEKHLVVDEKPKWKKEK